MRVRLLLDVTLLRGLVADAGLTQAQVARELGVSRSAVNGWVRGDRPIPRWRVAGLCAILGVTPTQLAGQEPVDRGACRPRAAVWRDDDDCWVCGQPTCVCHARRSA